MSALILERRWQSDETKTMGNVSITPAINPDYWAYRVVLSERQAIVGFPKFFTVGIGFAVEEDWNTNLPYTCPTQKIADHIAHNKADDAIASEDVLQAITLIQNAIREDLAAASEVTP